MTASLWRIAALAFVAMCAQDVLATTMVIFEAHYNAPMAGVFDVAQWLAAMVSSALAVEEIIRHGWRTRKAAVIFASVSAANFLGTFTGVALTGALTHHGGAG
jgi:hypothetical protein